MTPKGKTGLVIIIIIIVILVIVFGMNNDGEIVQPGDKTGSTIQIDSVTGIAATGDVDDVINSITADAQAEASLSTNVQEESALVASDTKALNDMDNSYDENKF